MEAAHENAANRAGSGVLVENRQSDVQLDLGRFGALVRDVLAAEGVPQEAHCGLAFVGREEIAELNQAHMGHAGPTDVLAFPIDLTAGVAQATNAVAQGEAQMVGDMMVGDVVVCPAVAAANAAAGAGSRSTHDGSVAAELDLLVTHGLLHLLGMDHAEPAEAEAMRAREEMHLERWNTAGAPR